MSPDLLYVGLHVAGSVLMNKGCKCYCTTSYCFTQNGSSFPQMTLHQKTVIHPFTKPNTKWILFSPKRLKKQTHKMTSYHKYKITTYDKLLQLLQM